MQFVHPYSVFQSDDGAWQVRFPAAVRKTALPPGHYRVIFDFWQMAGCPDRLWERRLWVDRGG